MISRKTRVLGRSLLALRRLQQIRSLTPCGRSSYSSAVPTLSYGRNVWGGAWQQHRHLSPVRMCLNVVSLGRLILVACHTGRIHARSIRHEESLRMIARTECRCASSVWRALKCDSCLGFASSHTPASRRTGCASIRVLILVNAC
jgi:hypothetical protein